MQHIADIGDPFPANLRNGQEGIGPSDVHKGAKALDRAHNALADLIHGQLAPQFFAFNRPLAF